MGALEDDIDANLREHRQKNYDSHKLIDPTAGWDYRECSVCHRKGGVDLSFKACDIAVKDSTLEKIQAITKTGQQTLNELISNTFVGYSTAVSGFAQYPSQGSNMVYPAMGLVGEAGELCDKIKKHWRNTASDNPYNAMSHKSLSADEEKEIIKEMGDVLWYLNALALELRTTLNEVAFENYLKLADRAKRNVIKSEGDNR